MSRSVTPLGRFDTGSLLRRDGRQHLDQLTCVGGREVMERHLKRLAMLAVAVAAVMAVQCRADMGKLDLRGVSAVATLDKPCESHDAPPFSLRTAARNAT